MRIPVMEPCDVLFHAKDPFYDESVRRYQGCPTVAATRGGRLYAGWYAGGRCEPHMDNYNILTFSDDLGAHWRAPLAIIPSDKDRLIHALDIELWIDPEGRLWVFWVQERVRKAVENDTAYVIDGYAFGCDPVHGMWAMVCDDPDADEPAFSPPRRLDDGFLRCKPTVLSDGRWMAFNYDQNHDRYGFSVSDDRGETWSRRYGAEKISTPFDEAMAVEKRDGTIHMLARTEGKWGCLAESESRDGGETWSEAKLSPFPDPSSRFFYARTPSGRLLLVKNDDARRRVNMTAFLSEDEGQTWPYRALLDPRENVSYPDADFSGGKIYLTHDRGRNTDNEILLYAFTEDDVIAGREIERRVVSKPGR